MFGDSIKRPVLLNVMLENSQDHLYAYFQDVVRTNQCKLVVNIKKWVDIENVSLRS